MSTSLEPDDAPKGSVMLNETVQFVFADMFAQYCVLLGVDHAPLNSSITVIFAYLIVPGPLFPSVMFICNVTFVLNVMFATVIAIGVTFVGPPAAPIEVNTPALNVCILPDVSFA